MTAVGQSLTLPQIPEPPGSGVYVSAWVIFEGDRGDVPRGTHRQLWRWFTRRGFRHCWVLRFENGRYIGLEATASFAQPGVLASGMDWPQWFVEQGHRVVLYRGWRPYTFLGRGVLTCVSLTKYVLGVRCWWVVTPYQLYRWLQRNGGREVTCDERRRRCSQTFPDGTCGTS